MNGYRALVVVEYDCSLCTKKLRVEHVCTNPLDGEAALRLDLEAVKNGWLIEGGAVICPEHTGRQVATSKAEIARRIGKLGRHSVAGISRALEMSYNSAYRAIKRGSDAD